MDTAEYRRQLTAHWNEDWTPDERFWKHDNGIKNIRAYRTMNYPWGWYSRVRSITEGIVEHVRTGDMENANKYMQKAIELMNLRLRVQMGFSLVDRHRHITDYDLIMATLDEIDVLIQKHVSYAEPVSDEIDARQKEHVLFVKPLSDKIDAPKKEHVSLDEPPSYEEATC
jgi:hypothetical protein